MENDGRTHDERLEALKAAVAKGDRKDAVSQYKEERIHYAEIIADIRKCVETKKEMRTLLKSLAEEQRAQKQKK